MMMELLSNASMFVLTVALIVLANNPSLRRTAFKFLSSVLMLRRRNKAAPRRLVSKTKRVTSIGDTITSSVPTMMESIVESSEETADGVEEPSGVLAAAKQSTDRDTKRNVRFGSLKESAVDEQAKVLKNENSLNASLHSTNSANSRVSFHESLHQPVAAVPIDAFSLDSIHSRVSSQRRESSFLKNLSTPSLERPAPSIPWLDDLANCGSSSVSSTRDESATVSEHGGEEFTNSAFSVNDSKDEGSIRSELSCRLRNRLVHGPKAAPTKKNKSRNGPSSSVGTDFESMPSSLSSDMLDRSCSPFRVVV
ncbi:hypothetical protein MPSEU_000319600 [Mayamaea pseudoterrestris]|nr:hypothetical protein MPSEU_000319600 [Mayamaea pseudoterrestris]